MSIRLDSGALSRADIAVRQSATNHADAAHDEGWHMPQSTELLTYIGQAKVGGARKMGRVLGTDGVFYDSAGTQANWLNDFSGYYFFDGVGEPVVTQNGEQVNYEDWGNYSTTDPSPPQTWEFTPASGCDFTAVRVYIYWPLVQFDSLDIPPAESYYQFQAFELRVYYKNNLIKTISRPQTSPVYGSFAGLRQAVEEWFNIYRQGDTIDTNDLRFEWDGWKYFPAPGYDAGPVTTKPADVIISTEDVNLSPAYNEAGLYLVKYCGGTAMEESLNYTVAMRTLDNQVATLTNWSLLTAQFDYNAITQTELTFYETFFHAGDNRPLKILYGGYTLPAADDFDSIPDMTPIPPTTFEKVYALETIAPLATATGAGAPQPGEYLAGDSLEGISKTSHVWDVLVHPGNAPIVVGIASHSRMTLTGGFDGDCLPPTFALYKLSAKLVSAKPDGSKDFGASTRVVSGAHVLFRFNYGMAFPTFKLLSGGGGGYTQNKIAFLIKVNGTQNFNFYARTGWQPDQPGGGFITPFGTGSYQWFDVDSSFNPVMSLTAKVYNEDDTFEFTEAQMTWNISPELAKPTYQDLVARLGTDPINGVQDGFQLRQNVAKTFWFVTFWVKNMGNGCTVNATGTVTSSKSFTVIDQLTQKIDPENPPTPFTYGGSMQIRITASPGEIIAFDLQVTDTGNDFGTFRYTVTIPST